MTSERPKSFPSCLSSPREQGLAQLSYRLWETIPISIKMKTSISWMYSIFYLSRSNYLNVIKKKASADHSETGEKKRNHYLYQINIPLVLFVMPDVQLNFFVFKFVTFVIHISHLGDVSWGRIFVIFLNCYLQIWRTVCWKIIFFILNVYIYFLRVKLTLKILFQLTIR